MGGQVKCPKGVTKVTTWQAQLVKMDKICIKREAVVSLWYTKKICPIFTQRRYLAVLPACPFPFLFCKQWAQENREVHTYTHKHKPSITFTFNWWRCQMISFFRKSRLSLLLANKWIVAFCRGGIYKSQAVSKGGKR